MRSMVESLHLPRRGSIPACPNRHIVCLACKEKILESARETGTGAICPTCKGPLIWATTHHSSLPDWWRVMWPTNASSLVVPKKWPWKIWSCMRRFANIRWSAVPAHILSPFDLCNHSTTMDWYVLVAYMQYPPLYHLHALSTSLPPLPWLLKRPQEAFCPLPQQHQYTTNLKQTWNLSIISPSPFSRHMKIYQKCVEILIFIAWNNAILWIFIFGIV